MNYLAHAVLNHNRGNEVLMGNMMGDFVKGNQYLNYSSNIQIGILLHRHIDTYTDAHPIVSKCKSIFRNDYGLFSGILVDTLMDYFVANDTAFFYTEHDLRKFVDNIYTLFETHQELMNEKMSFMMSKMKEHDWLYHYQYVLGIQSSFNGMAKRMKGMPPSAKANELFESNLDFFKENYLLLMEDLKSQFYVNL